MKSKGIFLQDVTFRYTGSNIEAISHLTFNILYGSFVGITGNNGSGKTTLSYLLNGLIPKEVDGKMEGQVVVDGDSTKDFSVSHFAQKVGVVFQNPENMIFNLSVAEEVAFGPGNLGLSDISTLVSKSLLQVGLAGFENRDPNTLSLGQKQKLCIASTLAMNTSYLVLDEPSSMLDYKSSIELYTLLKSFNFGGKTIIVIEHDTDLIATYASHAMVLDHGSLEMEGKVDMVFRNGERLSELGIKIPRGYL